MASVGLRNLRAVCKKKKDGQLSVRKATAPSIKKSVSKKVQVAGPKKALAVSTKNLQVLGSKRTQVVSSKKLQTVGSKMVQPVGSKKVPAVSTKVPAVSTKVQTVRRKKVQAVIRKKVPLVSNTDVPDVSSTDVPPVSNTNVPAVSRKKGPVVSNKKIPVVSKSKIIKSKVSAKIVKAKPDIVKKVNMEKNTVRIKLKPVQKKMDKVKLRLVKEASCVRNLVRPKMSSDDFEGIVALHEVVLNSFINTDTLPKVERKRPRGPDPFINKQQSFQCSLCSDAYGTIRMLDRHISLCHTGEECPMNSCKNKENRDYYKLEELIEHLNKNHPRFSIKKATDILTLPTKLPVI